jgi:hypothetical protein
MIKLKMKSKKERDNSTYQDINELLSFKEDSSTIWKFKDFKNQYNKHREQIENKKKIGEWIDLLSYFIIKFVTIGVIFYSGVSITSFILMGMLFLWAYHVQICGNVYRKKVFKKVIKGFENIVVDSKDILKNMFYEKYEKEKNADVIDIKVLQYVIDNLDKKNVNYRNFLELDLEDEYEKIKSQYRQLKSKKDELSLLKGLYD